MSKQENILPDGGKNPLPWCLLIQRSRARQVTRLHLDCQCVHTHQSPYPPRNIPPLPPLLQTVPGSAQARFLTSLKSHLNKVVVFLWIPIALIELCNAGSVRRMQSQNGRCISYSIYLLMFCYVLLLWLCIYFNDTWFNSLSSCHTPHTTSFII